ncbi:histidine triad protein HinT [Mesomycoplasma neurolyticum]|uniref:HIT-like protein n=1 Tax=Mesomycoplasma neurolyticum TaxID=2120 RepID=A0A449A635_9BACT|nr:HIT domain-containing protein [Mesomycoplasma neurolyticum]VEU59694.1 HIT-like protein [Mesomycoplasma neurolyticum]
MDKLFLKIINKELPAEIIYEDEKIIAFLDKFPVTNGHFLVVPKNYSRNLITISDDDLSYLMIKARELALIQIKKLNVKGFRLIVNNEPESKQVVFHTHVHIIPSEH